MKELPQIAFQAICARIQRSVHSSLNITETTKTVEV